MPSNIFSSYSTGENRITASILAVLESLSIERIERLLGAMMQSEFPLVHFENQIAEGGGGVPDAMITSSCRLFIETKRQPNSIQIDQLQRHLDKLGHATESTRVLLVLTPDDQPPKAIDELSGKPVVWTSFSNLDKAIDELLEDPNEITSEREGFLLRELQAMLSDERLVTSDKEVLVVPARRAWPEYISIHAYVCQADRHFQSVKRLAFYTNGQIQPLVPSILETHNNVRLFGRICGRKGP